MHGYAFKISKLVLVKMFVSISKNDEVNGSSDMVCPSRCLLIFLYVARKITDQHFFEQLIKCLIN